MAHLEFVLYGSPDLHEEFEAEEDEE